MIHKCASCGTKLDLTDKDLFFIRCKSKRDFYCNTCGQENPKANRYKGLLYKKLGNNPGKLYK